MLEAGHSAKFYCGENCVSSFCKAFNLFWVSDIWPLIIKHGLWPWALKLYTIISGWIDKGVIIELKAVSERENYYSDWRDWERLYGLVGF